MFEEEWEARSLFGWETVIGRMLGDKKEDSNKPVKDPLFCPACNKSFTSENVFHHHKKGKRHIKAVNQL